MTRRSRHGYATTRATRAKRRALHEHSSRSAGRKSLMLLSGGAYPELADEIAGELGVTVTPTTAREFANGETVHPPDESVRGSDAFVIQAYTHADQPVGDGEPDPGRRAQARLGQADHRRHAVLPVRPAGQEAPRPRADLGPADRRPVQDGRRRPADGGRPAHRADPGLLRRSGRPPVRAAAAGRLRPGQVPGDRGPRSSSRPTPAGCGWPSSGPTGSAACRSPSSTRRATRRRQRGRRQPGRR